MNSITFMGRIATDPEYFRTASGKVVCKFWFAVDRRFKQEGQPDADFFSCVAFDGIAETFGKCQVAKGTKLLLGCEARNNNWEDKEHRKHYDIIFYINAFEFCESKKKSDEAPATNEAKPTKGTKGTKGSKNNKSSQTFTPQPVDDDDDLPF
ncbi:MAG TPA: single-stranded DNA-binding protein [Lachnospiraceae bacterium]|nr:single-stranded DNA-binding protein [Lachnospiraceae bacterium]